VNHFVCEQRLIFNEQSIWSRKTKERTDLRSHDRNESSCLSSVAYSVPFVLSLLKSRDSSGSKYTSKFLGTTRRGRRQEQWDLVRNSFGKETRQSFIKSNGQHLPRVSSATESDGGRVTRLHFVFVAAEITVETLNLHSLSQ